MTIALLLGGMIGLALGLLGGGGSIITVPALVYGAGVAPANAVTMSLIVVGATSAIGGFLSQRRGTVHWKAAFYFGATGGIGAIIGSMFTRSVSGEVLLILFAILMLTIASYMLFKKGCTDVEPAPDCRPIRCASVGMGVGVLTGFLGVGGGFLIVPAMIKFARLPLKTAVGTSLVVIAANSVFGWLAHAGSGTIDWPLTAGFAAFALIGLSIGLRLADRMPVMILNRAFAWFVMAVAVFVIMRNVSSLT